MQEKSDFISLYNTFIVKKRLFDVDVNLGLSVTFTHSPESALSDIKSRDINVIIGFFGAENARNVLCSVSIIVILLVLYNNKHPWK